jgi:AcrR family transcriptional regulator
MKAKRGGLSRELIVDAATQIINETGLESLTIARLGKEIHADPTALYRYYVDKDELVLDVLDSFVNAVLADFTPNDDWRENLRRFHLVLRERFLTHPGIARALGEAETSPPAAHRAAGLVIAQLEAAGLRNVDVTSFYRVLTGYLFGSSMMDGSTVGDGPWVSWSTFFRSIDGYTPPEELLSIDGSRAEAQRAFHVGLDAIITAIETTAAAS